MFQDVPKTYQIERMGRKPNLIDFPYRNGNSQSRCPGRAIYGQLRSMAFPSLSFKQLKKGTLTTTDIQDFPRAREKLLYPPHPIPGKKKSRGFEPGVKFLQALPVIILLIELGDLFFFGAGTQKNQTTLLAFQVRKREAPRIGLNIDFRLGAIGAEHAASFFHIFPSNKPGDDSPIIGAPWVKKWEKNTVPFYST